MNPRLEALREQRAEIHKKASELADKAADENRNFDEREQAAWDSLTGKLAAYDRRIDEMIAEEKRLDEAAGAFDRLSKRPVTGPRGDGAEVAKFPSWSEYRNAPEPAYDLFESRAVGSGSNAFIQPEQATVWYDRLRANSAFLQANPLQVTVADTQLNIPRVSGSGTAAMIAENGTMTPTDPTFAQVSLTQRKAYYFNQCSNEALDDSTPALQEVLATAFTRDLATLIDTQLLTGSGTLPNLRGAINSSVRRARRTAPTGCR